MDEENIVLRYQRTPDGLAAVECRLWEMANCRHLRPWYRYYDYVEDQLVCVYEHKDRGM